MLSTQTNIALQIVATLSEEEKATFAVEFQKMYVPKIMPKKKKKVFDFPSPEVLAEQHLAKHRAKFASQTQV
jgi:hypothetical protein